MWRIAEEKFPLLLTSLVSKIFANVKELTPEHYIMLNKYPEYIHRYSDFFDLMSAPINVEEMKKMKDVSLEYVFVMVDGIIEALDAEVIDLLDGREWG